MLIFYFFGTKVLACFDPAEVTHLVVLQSPMQIEHLEETTHVVTADWVTKSIAEGVRYPEKSFLPSLRVLWLSPSTPSLLTTIVHSWVTVSRMKKS